jgi:hypothetical protein
MVDFGSVVAGREPIRRGAGVGVVVEVDGVSVAGSSTGIVEVARLETRPVT